MSKFPFVAIEYAVPAVELIFNQAVLVELTKRVAPFAIKMLALRNQFLGDV
jgi:hypothetical protein